MDASGALPAEPPPASTPAKIEGTASTPSPSPGASRASCSTELPSSELPLFTNLCSKAENNDAPSSDAAPSLPNVSLQGLLERESKLAGVIASAARQRARSAPRHRFCPGVRTPLTGSSQSSPQYARSMGCFAKGDTQAMSTLAAPNAPASNLSGSKESQLRSLQMQKGHAQRRASVSSLTGSSPRTFRNISTGFCCIDLCPGIPSF